MDSQGRTEEQRIQKNLYLQAYRSTHKDEIASKRNVLTRCTCGLDVYKRHIDRHTRSRNHTSALNKQVALIEEKTNSDIANYIATFLCWVARDFAHPGN